MTDTKHDGLQMQCTWWEAAEPLAAFSPKHSVLTRWVIVWNGDEARCKERSDRDRTAKTVHKKTAELASRQERPIHHQPLAAAGV